MPASTAFPSPPHPAPDGRWQHPSRSGWLRINVPLWPTLSCGHPCSSPGLIRGFSLWPFKAQLFSLFMIFISLSFAPIGAPLHSSLSNGGSRHFCNPTLKRLLVCSSAACTPNPMVVRGVGFHDLHLVNPMVVVIAALLIAISMCIAVFIPGGTAYSICMVFAWCPRSSFFWWSTQFGSPSIWGSPPFGCVRGPLRGSESEALRGWPLTRHGAG